MSRIHGQPLPATLAGCVAADLVTGVRGLSLVVLGEDGGLRRWDVATAQVSAPVAVSLSGGGTPVRQRWQRRRPWQPRVVASPFGRFAAVVQDYGRYGVVVDRYARRVTMSLDAEGDDLGYEDLVLFSAAFITWAGREVLVHRTAWNRLDVSDPADGRLLTPRGSTSFAAGEERPSHYLDYFHGDNWGKVDRASVSGPWRDGAWFAGTYWCGSDMGLWALQDDSWLRRHAQRSSRTLATRWLFLAIHGHLAAHPAIPLAHADHLDPDSGRGTLILRAM